MYALPFVGLLIKSLNVSLFWKRNLILSEYNKKQSYEIISDFKLKVEISFPIPWNGCTPLFWTIKRSSESLFIDSGFYDNDH